MLTRMKHPVHGFTHVYTYEELEAHKKRGWVEEKPEVEEPEVEEPAVKPVRNRKKDSHDESLV